MIQAAHLAKRYRKKIAVDDVSFNVAMGKVTGFLGPNGAGKSTTMRLMLGLDNGDGQTLFDGKPLHAYIRPSRIVGILLEAKAFHPTRTARDHLRVLAAEGGITDKRVDEVLDIVGLSKVARKAPGKFSLGMSQRLGIAAALLGEPKHLILDEPSNGLDPEGVAWMRGFLKDYASQGNAVFVSSHLLSEMQQMAEEVVVIAKGKLLASTSMQALTGGSGHASVFVRTADNARLEKSFKREQVAYEVQDTGLVVKGLSTDEVGKLAFAAGTAVLELAPRQASLEQVFLELTEGKEEFPATGESS